jgi:hypothetical protein
VLGEVFRGLELFERVPLPFLYFLHHPHGLLGAVGLCRITRVLFVRQIGGAACALRARALD